MIPEFDIRQKVKLKLSNDKVSQLMSPLLVAVLIVYIVVTKSWHTVSPIPIIILIIIVLLEQAALVIPKTKKMPVFQSGGPAPLIVYNIAIFIILVFYVPLYSPFLFSAAVITFITVYFRGLLILAASILFWALTVATYTIVKGYPHVPAGHLIPYLAVALGAIFTVIVQRAGAIDSEIRKDLITANDKIHEESQELSSLINGINYTVIATDLEGKIRFYNSMALSMLKMRSIAVNDDFTKYILLFDEQNREVNLVTQVKQNPGIKRYHGLHTFDSRKDRIDVSIEVSTVTIKQTNTNTYEFIFLIRDISSEKSLDEERDEFAAITSHELRTPIDVAETNISLAMNRRVMSTIDEESRERLKIAHHNVIYLSELIEQLAELSDIEGPSQKTVYEEVNLPDLINYLYINSSKSASVKGVSLNTNVLGDLQSIYTCREYLAQILQNYLTNAVKRTQTGQIVLSAQRSSKYPDGVLFSVSDSGTGVDITDKAKMASKEYSEEDFSKVEDRGLGLGLYLAHKLAGYINGKVWFTSKANQGSTFYLEIQPIDRNSKATQN